MRSFRRRAILLVLLLAFALLFSACTPDSAPEQLTLTEAEKQDWTTYLSERFIAVLPEFTRADGPGDLDLTGYLFRYLWEKRDTDTLAPFTLADYYPNSAPTGKIEALRLPLAELQAASLYLFNQTPAGFQGGGPLAVENDNLWIFPHGLEEYPTLPRVVGCAKNSDGTLTFRVEFYGDEYDFNGNVMHAADGTELTHDEFLTKLPDETFLFQEAPFLKRQITVENLDDPAGDRYVIVENIAF